MKQTDLDILLRECNWGRVPILFISQELDFIINYDIKCRMGRDAGKESEKEDN